LLQDGHIKNKTIQEELDKMLSFVTNIFATKKCDRCRERKVRSALHQMLQENLLEEGYTTFHYCEDCYKMEQKFQEEFAKEIGDFFEQTIKRKIPCHCCGYYDCLC
jgi:hypothetical protein